MSEADFQLVVTSITAVVVAITGSFTAYYGYKNHQVGQSNAAKIDQVQATTDGATHTLAASLAATQSKNEDLIRSLAAGAPQPPPPAP